MRSVLDSAGTLVAKSILLLSLTWMAVAFGRIAVAQETRDMLSTIPLHDLSSFRSPGDNWHIAGDVFADPAKTHHLQMEAGTGVLVCVPTENDRENLFTEWEHGDLTLELDFMMPAGSNSGIYLQGRYEVQLFDSWGVRHPNFGDVGGIYQRWDPSLQEGRRGFGGVSPRMNAGRAPGLWQHLEIDFRAPRFDENGRKIESARFDRVVLNGIVIQENVTLTGPTRAAAFENEVPTGPLMIQGDHGPVALRNIRFKRFGTESVRLSDLTYRVYGGEFDQLPDLSGRVADRVGELEGFRHDVTGSLESFAAAFNGTISVPTTGPYQFELDLQWVDDDPHFEENPSGGAVLRIDGETALEHEGSSSTATDVINLEAGDHALEMTYFKNVSWMGPTARLAVEGPDTRRRLLNVATSLPAPTLVAPIRVDVERKPVLHRHMVDVDTTRRTHAISVGDPLGIHYTIDLNSGVLLRVWRGPFLDATPMWHGRGYHQLAVPRGSAVSLNGTLVNGLADPLTHDRYELDENGRPTFHFEAGGMSVSDRIEPVLDGRALRRRVTVEGDVEHIVATSEAIERLPDGSYAVGDRSYIIRFEGDARPRVRVAAAGHALSVPITNGTVTYTIIW